MANMLTSFSIPFLIICIIFFICSLQGQYENEVSCSVLGLEVSCPLISGSKYRNLMACSLLQRESIAEKSFSLYPAFIFSRYKFVSFENKNF